jgi:hypothetical protein
VLVGERINSNLIFDLLRSSALHFAVLEEEVPSPEPPADPSLNAADVHIDPQVWIAPHAAIVADRTEPNVVIDHE